MYINIVTASHSRFISDFRENTKLSKIYTTSSTMAIAQASTSAVEGASQQYVPTTATKTQNMS